MSEDPIDEARIRADAPERRQPMAAIRRLLELRDETALRYQNAPAVSWETLKSWMRDEDDDVAGSSSDRPR
jgi:hypothetical protein